MVSSLTEILLKHFKVREPKKNWAGLRYTRTIHLKKAPKKTPLKNSLFGGFSTHSASRNASRNPQKVSYQSDSISLWFSNLSSKISVRRWFLSSQKFYWNISKLENQKKSSRTSVYSDFSFKKAPKKTTKKLTFWGFLETFCLLECIEKPTKSALPVRLDLFMVL